MSRASRPVPCGSCTACCREEAIFLHPDEGDRPAEYLTRPLFNPITKQMALAIAQRPDRSCVYLGNRGCTIYARRPLICRSFDCRRLYALFAEKLPAGQLDQMVVAAPPLQAARNLARGLPAAGILAA